MKRLSNVVECRAFDFSVLFLIILSSVALAVETLPGLPPFAKRALRVFDAAVVVIFTIEYGIRLARWKMRYVRSFYGVIDLAAILPFYLLHVIGLSLGIDLRAIRVFRLFRVFRILKLARYNSAMTRLGKAVSDVKEEFMVVLFAAIMLLYLAAIGIYYFEHDAQPENFRSVFHSLWWAVATLTTVGYGDVYVITAGGKIFTFGVLMCGLGVVSAPAGLLAAALSKSAKDNSDEKSGGALTLLHRGFSRASRCRILGRKRFPFPDTCASGSDGGVHEGGAA